MNFNELLKKLKLSYPELIQLLRCRTQGFSKKEKVQLFNFLTSCPELLLHYLTMNGSVEEAIYYMMDIKTGLLTPNSDLQRTEMDLAIGIFFPILTESDVINAVYFGGISILEALRRAKENKGTVAQFNSSSSGMDRGSWKALKIKGSGIPHKKQ